MASDAALTAGIADHEQFAEDRDDASSDDRPAVESIRLGRVLAKSVRVGDTTCPVGACGVLLLTLTLSLSMSIWGAGVAYNIGDDATPDIDGFVPRGTEIGNRDNTFSLLLSGCEKTGLTNKPGSACCAAAADEGACAQLGAQHCHWEGGEDSECKSIEESCAATDDGDAATTGSGGATATIAGGGPGGNYAPADATGAAPSPAPEPAAGSHSARVLPPVELYCDACERSVQVVFRPRDGSSNMLTADLIHAMCDYEQRFQVEGHCQPTSDGSCCGARTIGTALAHAVGREGGCHALTDADVGAALQLVLDCKETCVDDPTGWLSSLPISGANCDKVLGLPAVKCSTDLSDYPLIASRFTVPAGMLVSELCPASCGVCTARLLPPRCDPVRQPVGHFKSVVEAVLGSDSAHTDGFTDVTFGVDGSLESGFLRSWMCFPAVPEGEDDEDKSWLRKQWWAEADPAYTDDSLPIVPLWRDIVRGDVEDDKVQNDLAMGGLCFLLIYLYLLFHTQSCFTSTLGMLHVFISFFVAYAIHKSCVSEWFPFLLFIGLFVICGVGADDIFVFVDGAPFSLSLSSTFVRVFISRPR